MAAAAAIVAGARPPPRYDGTGESAAEVVGAAVGAGGLESMRASALQRRAAEAGAGHGELEAAIDSADARAALISLIVRLGAVCHDCSVSSRFSTAALGEVVGPFLMCLTYSDMLC